MFLLEFLHETNGYLGIGLGIGVDNCQQCNPLPGSNAVSALAPEEGGDPIRIWSKIAEGGL